MKNKSDSANFRRAPRLSADIQFEIRRYLLAKREQALAGLSRAVKDYETTRLVFGSTRQVEYWKDAISVIDWLCFHVDKRQSYLSELQIYNEEE